MPASRSFVYLYTLAATGVLITTIFSSSARGPVRAEDCDTAAGYTGQELTDSELSQLSVPLNVMDSDWFVAYMNLYQDLTRQTYEYGDHDQIQRIQDCRFGIASTPVPTFTLTPRASVRITPTPSAVIGSGFDAECAALAQDWVEQFAMTSDGITTASGCYLALDGSWFFPTSPDDARMMAQDRTTSEEKQETNLLRGDILRQIELLESSLPGYLAERMGTWYSPTQRPLYGHFDSSVSTGGVQSQYTDALDYFITAPSAWQLRDYAIWWGRSHATALPFAVSASFPPPVYEGIEGQLRLDWAPFPWDLRDPLTLNAYLKWKLRSS